MRNHLINKITELAEEDKNIILITGDLGFGVLDSFQKKYPKRFINAGIAEQNMAAIAAGLALEGNKVFIYSIGNFPTLRCIEQIRNDICYHNANVKILAVGSGFAYGTLGMTHHATEDLAIMRALPNMKVFTPCDSISAEAIAQDICKINGPCYVRLERGGEPEIFSKNEKFEIGKLKEIRKGYDIAVITIGTVINEAIKAADILREQNNYISVYSVYSLKPIDKEQILEIAKKYKYIITVEEHQSIGGLGSTIAEIIAENNMITKIIRLGLNNEFTSVVGNQEYLREVYKINYKNIIKICEEYYING